MTIGTLFLARTHRLELAITVFTRTYRLQTS